jgi:glycosyltransferase involved in cell wall biosynthesis
MATYNGAKYIKEQMDSIIPQLSMEDEIIVSDDGSTDNTLDIIEKYNDARIKIYVNKGIHGYTHNFENAMQHACGDYIFLSDQDDIWLPNKVNTMLRFLQENDENLVICNGYIVNEQLESMRTIKDARNLYKSGFLRNLYKSGFLRNLYKSGFWGCTFAFSKRIKDYCLPISKQVTGHDGWIGLLCELKFRILYVDEPLMLYRRHSGNASNPLSIWRKLTTRIWFLIETLRRFLTR